MGQGWQIGLTPIRLEAKVNIYDFSQYVGLPWTIDISRPLKQRQS